MQEDKKTESEKTEVSPAPGAPAPNNSPSDPSQKSLDANTTSSTAAQKPGKKSFKDFVRTKKGKIILAITGAVVAIGLVFAIPASRYAVAGLVIKKDVAIVVIDSKTSRPVSGAQLTFAAQTVTSDGNGKVTVHQVPVGPWAVMAKKANYKDAKADILVPILTQPDTIRISMEATGRQVPVTVINKITGKT